MNIFMQNIFICMSLCKTFAEWRNKLCDHSFPKNSILQNFSQDFQQQKLSKYEINIFFGLPRPGVQLEWATSAAITHEILKNGIGIPPPAPLIGQDDEHARVAITIRQLQHCHLVDRILTQPGHHPSPHERDSNLGSASDRAEQAGDRLPGIELFSPQRFEVERVDQDQSGERIYISKKWNMKSLNILFFIFVRFFTLE
jgi:hypothetical protein